MAANQADDERKDKDRVGCGNGMNLYNKGKNAAEFNTRRSLMQLRMLNGKRL